MKRIIAVIVLLLLTFTGCASWMDGSYVHITPHQEEKVSDKQEIVDAFSYMDLRNALIGMVESSTQSAVFAVSRLDMKFADYYMDVAIGYIKDSFALGAYTVSDITYEFGTNQGNHVVAVEVSYNQNRSEVLRMRQIQNMTDAEVLIGATLDQCESSVVFMVEEYTETDLVQLAEKYVQHHPEKVMELPEVTVAVYPDTGNQRIVEMNFIYKTDRQTLLAMQESVEPIFTSASLAVGSEADDMEKYAQLCAFLVERCDHTLEASVTPTYSLLCNGVGDSKAFAYTYAALCRQEGLNCLVVSDTLDGMTHYWNVVCLDGQSYQLDLIECDKLGLFSLQPEDKKAREVQAYTVVADFVGQPE